MSTVLMILSLKK